MSRLAVLVVGIAVAAIAADAPTSEAARAAAAAPIGAEPLIVGWLKPARIFGRFGSARHDDVIELEERACGSPAFTPMTVEPHAAPNGEWQFFWGPTITTTYRARFRGEVSETVTVRVRPHLVLRQRVGREFLITALSVRPFWRKTAVFERFNRSTERWIRLRTVRFDETGATPGTTAWSKGRFTSRVPKGTLVRVNFAGTQARPCYAGGFSNMLVTR